MNVALIPARGGSKSIPLKNIKPLNGKPLVYWAAKAASECRYVDQVVVATDHDRIRAVVNGFDMDKVSVFERSAENATDEASTESLMLEFATHHPARTIVMIQATSPLLTSPYLDRGFELFNGGKFDSVISVFRQKRMLLEERDGALYPTNYDVHNRPRRQEWDGLLVENGCFFITSKDMLLKSECRMGGTLGYVEMPEKTYWELDDPDDWALMEWLMQHQTAQPRPSDK